MPRTERKRSITGIYHVMLRGINHQNIFEDNEDHRIFLECVAVSKKLSGFKLYAYCLMSNHLHLLIEEGDEPLSTVFRRIGARYVFRYNWKYERTGHLFQDRYRSEPVESDDHFMAVLRYIYQNPVKSGLSADVSNYPWSSYHLLDQEGGLMDNVRLFEIMPLDDIRKFVKEQTDETFLDVKTGRQPAYSDTKAAEILMEICGARNIAQFQLLSLEQQLLAVRRLRERKVPVRQQVRITGLSKGVVEKYHRLSREDV
jgi:REP element-mobilizing transposase RayT